MHRLVDVARDNGAAALVGTVLRENEPMLNLTRELGFTQEPGDSPEVVQVRLAIA